MEFNSFAACPCSKPRCFVKSEVYLKSLVKLGLSRLSKLLIVFKTPLNLVELGLPGLPGIEADF